MNEKLLVEITISALIAYVAVLFLVFDTEPSLEVSLTSDLVEGRVMEAASAVGGGAWRESRVERVGTGLFLLDGPGSRPQSREREIRISLGFEIRRGVARIDPEIVERGHLHAREPETARERDLMSALGGLSIEDVSDRTGLRRSPGSVTAALSGDRVVLRVFEPAAQLVAAQSLIALLLAVHLAVLRVAQQRGLRIFGEGRA